MTVVVRGRVPRRKDGKFSDESANNIEQRLLALERDAAGRAPTFVSPTAPTFGGGIVPAPGGGGPGPGGGGGGVTDHGVLTGLGDHDHLLYVQHGEASLPLPHQHNVEEVVGVDQQYVRRLEKVSPAPHAHRIADVVDLYPDSDQFVLASRVFGG